MNRTIKKVAVLGSGVMGSRIACHFANIGVQVLLLDIAPKELLPDEEKKGLKLEAPAVRNRIVNAALQAAIVANPSPLYRKADASRIKTGNFDDNLKDIAGCDWTIEVVVERLDIKKSLFERVEQFRKKGTLITSNTSGIPIHLMTEGRSDDFKKHFCGTHFFNPPRYLKLLEIIPTPDTDPAIVDFLLHYGDLYLGKTTVLAKDTPAFHRQPRGRVRHHGRAAHHAGAGPDGGGSGQAHRPGDWPRQVGHLPHLGCGGARYPDERGQRPGPGPAERRGQSRVPAARVS